MAYTHTLVQVANLPEGQWSDAGNSETGDATFAVERTVEAESGGSTVDVEFAVASAALQSIILLSTVNCVVTFTGVTEFDGAAGSPTADDVTLTANVIRQVKAITGDCSAIHISKNTTTSGPAGTINIGVLYNS